MAFLSCQVGSSAHNEKVTLLLSCKVLIAFFHDPIVWPCQVEYCKKLVIFRTTGTMGAITMMSWSHDCIKWVK